MTIIVLKDGVMAADRLMSYAGCNMAPGCKLLTGETDRYWFVSGLAGTSQSRADELKLSIDTLITQSPVKMTAPYELVIFAIHKVTRDWLLVNVEQEPNGDLSATTYEQGEDFPEYFAIGAGIDMALGAFAAGASAVQAVLATNKHSLKCGEGYNAAGFDILKPGFTIHRG